MNSNFIKVAPSKKVLLDLSCDDSALESIDSFANIKANTEDGAKEKHVPEFRISDGEIEVCVGSVLHPMSEEHYIEFIALESKQGIAIKYLQPGMEPKASFVLSKDDMAVKVYAYCNLHGLWSKDI